MKLEEIESLWEKDSKVDQTDLTRESLIISELHSKYYNVLSREKIAMAKCNIAYKKLKRLKQEYYTGTLDKQTLNEYEWEPWRLKVLRQDLDIYFDSDKDMTEAVLAVAEQQQKVDFLDSIIKTLNSRNFNIKNAIDFLKFTNGINF